MSTTGASTDQDSHSELSGFSSDEEADTYERQVVDEGEFEVVSLNQALANLGIAQSLTSGDNRMTVENLRKLCSQRHMYEHALELNEVLYFQQQGFSRIENLDVFRNCVSLFLNNNCIRSLRGAFAGLRNLKQLYLNFNNIDQIAREDFADNRDLEYVNLSSNKLTDISSLSFLPKLKTLLVSNNLITELASLGPISDSLETLDFSGNPVNTEISDDDFFAFCASNFRSLKQLYTSGCPLVSRVGQFRRRVTLELPEICFLDKFPITDEDRVLAAAWVRGGRDEEIRVRTDLHGQKRQAMDDVLSNFRKFQAEGVEAQAGVRLAKEQQRMSCEDEAAQVNTQLSDDIRRILSSN